MNDLGANESKIQMIVLANSHGMIEAQKPGILYDFVIKLASPELCNKQVKHILLMLKEDENTSHPDDTNLAQMLKDQKVFF